MEETLLSIIQAAKKLEVTRQRVYVWVRAGRIPSIKFTNDKGQEVTRILESNCVHPKMLKPGPKRNTPPKPPKKLKLGRKPYNRKQPVRLT